MIERQTITNRQEWLQWRERDLTASDVGAVFGHDRFRSPLRIFREKRGEVPATVENNAMRRGRWLEVAVLYALREERPTWHIEAANCYLRDPDIRLGASPDAFAWVQGEEGVVNVQLKTVSRFVYDRDWSDSTAPLGYTLQVLTEGLLVNAIRSVLVALVIDAHTADLAIREIPRSPQAEAIIRQKAVDFWASVEAGMPPPADYAKDAETINAMYPQAKPGTIVDLSADNRLPDLLVDRAELKSSIGILEGRVTTIDAEIKDKLGEVETATLPGWRVSWKNEVTHYKAQPAKEARDVTTRKFRVSPTGEEVP